MAWVAPVVSLIGTIGGMVAGMKKDKQPEQARAPEMPTVQNAEEEAKKKLEQRRRRMLMGGETDITSGGINILNTNPKRTLLA
jgi:hypothetical protein